jgi:hypothetical protein
MRSSRQSYKLYSLSALIRNDFNMGMVCGIVEVPNSQRICCLDSSLGRVPACGAGDPGPILGGGNLNVCLQDTLLEDRDDPSQVSL